MRTAIVALLLASAAIAASRAPATQPAAIRAWLAETKPSRPPTYAELKAENERLRVQIAGLIEEVERLRPKPNGQAIREGMTLEEAEAAAASKAILISEEGDRRFYSLRWNDGIPVGDPPRKIAYRLVVVNGKVTLFSSRLPGIQSFDVVK